MNKWTRDLRFALLESSCNRHRYHLLLLGIDMAFILQEVIRKGLVITGGRCCECVKCIQVKVVTLLAGMTVISLWLTSRAHVDGLASASLRMGHECSFLTFTDAHWAVRC